MFLYIFHIVCFSTVVLFLFFDRKHHVDCLDHLFLFKTTSSTAEAQCNPLVDRQHPSCVGRPLPRHETWLGLRRLANHQVKGVLHHLKGYYYSKPEGTPQNRETVYNNHRLLQKRPLNQETSISKTK